MAPIADSIDFGYVICMVAAFVWASIDYNRFIKFWMRKPAPYNGRVLIIFRLFFLACVSGGLWQVARTALGSARPAMFYVNAIPFAVGFFVAFVLMFHLVERRYQKRIDKQMTASGQSDRLRP